ncbi:MAG: ABC transporter substrate-binding protein [Actinomycetota bacterium]|nr:ABC transporter substrate-binding protein [Actinomycetota bacterium]
MRVALALGLVVVLVLGGGCGSKQHKQATLVVAVDAPFSRTPYVGETIEHGVALAIADVNARGGIVSRGTRYTLRVKRSDNALSPRKAVENVRRALQDDAVAIVTDGTGMDATWELARDAGVPICIVYEGGIGLVDPDRRPNVFRIAPTDRGISFRLAEYIVPKGLKIALLTDDSGYGQHGRSALKKAFRTIPRSVAARITLPTSASDLSPQVLAARRSGATALLVWAQAPTLAKTIAAARTFGWQVPIFTTPSGEDPLVRQQLADHPSWIDGLTFGSGRMTAERGPAPWNAYASRYEQAYGADFVGVKTRSGQRVVQPPDYGMYPFDFVNVLAAALTQSKGQTGAKLLDALNEVTTEGANGDQRGFNRRNHEGVVDDDVYFARFRDMIFRPVKDDPLSSTLPTIPQTR